MSPVTQLSILALASAAFAVPYHGHQHEHFHSPQGYGSSASGHFAYSGTKPWGSSGTGFPTGAYGSLSKAAISPVGGYGAQTTVTVNAVGDSSSAAAGTSDCSDDVTITSTQKTTVYVTATSGLGSDVSAVVEETTTSGGKVLTLKSTVFRTVHSTVYVTPSASGYGSSPVGSIVSSYASSPASSIVSPVTFSSSSFSSSFSSSSSSSTSTSSTSSSSSSVAPFTPPAYTPPTTSSSSAAPTTSSSSSAAPTTPTSSSTSVWTAPAYTPPTTSSSSAAPTMSSSSSSSAAPSSTYQPIANAIQPSSTSSTWAAASSSAAPVSSGSGKRGLAYNDASLTSMFSDSSSVSWAYNWGSSTKGLASNLNYIPLLWGLASEFTGPWMSNAKSAIGNGATHVFSFNEPDFSGQANLSPEAAAAAWATFLEPLAGSAKLCAPAVTNGPGDMGLTWLGKFLKACSGCTIDCINIHWYDSAQHSDYFKSHVTNATTIGGGRPVFISEIGASGSDDQVTAFLQDVMPWMDSNKDVAGYAYFMVGQGLLVNGNSPSSYGQTYKSFTGP